MAEEPSKNELSQRRLGEVELLKLNRTLRALSNSAQAMMHATNEPEYLERVCRIIVDDCGYALVWIGYAENDDAKSVRPVAYSGFEEGYLDTLQLTWADTERGRGPTGTAIRTGRPIICRNMLTDPLFTPWREQALKRGYAASIALPLMAGDKALGALTIYAREPDPFSDAETRLLAELADDLAHGITTLRIRVAQSQAEAALRRSEERYRDLVEQTVDGIFVSDAKGRYLDVNSAGIRMLGYSRDELLRLSMSDVIAAEEVQRIAPEVARFADGHVVRSEWRFRRKNGSYFPGEVVGRRLPDGRLQAILRDITDRKGAEQERETAAEFLRLVNESRSRRELVQAATTFFRKESGCDAVGIRLMEGLDYPYVETRGFSEGFLLDESNLCARDAMGHVIKDGEGHPVLECMCGDVIRGRTDPSKPWYTMHGSFWTNSTTELRASTTIAGRQARTRNRCNSEGYESVALLPLRVGAERLGLLQFNDRRKGLFLPETIALWERLTGYLSVALAKLRADEEREALARFPDENPSPVLRVSSSGLVLYVNPAAVSVPGWACCVGEPIPDVLTPFTNQAFAQRKMLEVDVAIGERIFAFSIAPFPSEGYANVYGRDVTSVKRTERLLRARLQLVAAASTDALPVAAALQMAIDEIEAQTGSKVGFYHFVENDQETVSLQFWSTNTLRNMCTAEGAGSHYPISRAGVWVDCVRERRPIIHNDYASLPHRRGLPSGHAPIAREVVVPILRGDRIVAIIGVGNKPTDYDATDVEIVSLLGEFSWEVAERKRAEQALRQNQERQAILADTASRLLATKEPQKIVNELCERVMAHLDCQTFFNYLADEKANRLHLNACEGIPAEKAKELEWLDFGVAVCGCVAQQGCRIVAEDIPNTPDPRTDLVRSFGLKAYACHPLLSQGRVIGTLSFGTRARPSFSEADLALMKGVTDLVATAMERVRAEERLRETRDYLDNLLNHANAPIIVWDQTSKITRFNRAFEHLTGRRAHEVIGQSLDCLFPSEGRDEAYAQIRRTKEGERWETVEIPILHTGGSVRTVLWNSATLFSPDDKTVIATIAQGQDVTEQRRAEEALLEANANLEHQVSERTRELRMTNVKLTEEIQERKRAEAERLRVEGIARGQERLAMLGELAAGVAHELRNPLQGVMSYMDLVKLEINHEHALTPLLRHMEDGLRDMDRVAAQLLDLSRQDRDPAVATVLGSVIERAWGFLQVRATKQGVAMSLDIEHGLPLVKGNPARLTEAFLNLLKNSLDALSEPGAGVPGTIKVTARLHPRMAGMVEVLIADNGPGIPAGIQGKVFQPFFTTKPSGKGTGLGLAMVRKMTESCGGYVELAASPLPGTTIGLGLPVAKENDAGVDSTGLIIA